MKAKRIISSLVACAMVASTITAMTASVNAVTQELTASVDNITAEAGSSFSLNVNLSDVASTGIQALEFAVKYDPSLVTIDSVTEGAIALTGAADAELGIAPDLAGSNINSGDYSCMDYNIAADKGTVSVMWVTGMTDSQYWISDDGVFLTLNGTVSADASGTIPIEIVPIDRETYPGSGTKNTSIIFGYLDEATASCVTYNTKTVNGSITVAGETTTTTVTTVSGPETTTSETTTQPTGTTKDPSGIVYGDVTGEGKVNIIDLQKMAQHVIGSVLLTGDALVAGDINADGKVNILDVMSVASYIVGNTDHLGPNK